MRNLRPTESTTIRDLRRQIETLNIKASFHDAALRREEARADRYLRLYLDTALASDKHMAAVAVKEQAIMRLHEDIARASHAAEYQRGYRETLKGRIVALQEENAILSIKRQPYCVTNPTQGRVLPAPHAGPTMCESYWTSLFADEERQTG